MIKQLLVLSAASVLIGGGLITTKAIADQSTLIAQTSAPLTEQREEGSRLRRSSKFERLTGITDAQKTQLRQIHEASHQQIDAIPTAEQKAQMQAIRRDTKNKMDAVLTDEQRQQLQQSSPSGGGSRVPKISGLTDAQRTQMGEILSASRQQMDAILTSEQKAQIQAIRQDTKTKMDAVLTDQQRQQLQELRQQKRQDRQQRQS